LLLLTYMRTREQLRNAAIVTLAGFGVLAWHAFLLHWFTTYSFAGQPEIEFGSLAHVNYAAAFTSVVIFSLLVASRHVSKRWLLAIVLIALPLCIMQAPLGSRTTLLLLALTVTVYIILKRPGWIATILTLSSIVLVLGILSQTQSGLSQFSVVDKPLEKATVYVRTDIWKTLFYTWQEAPLGVGPKNSEFIDLNRHREWIHQNIPLSAKRFYGKEAMENGLQGIDLNKTSHFVTDPHSHYVSLFAENGPLGLLAYLSYLLAAFLIAIRHSFVTNNWTSGFAEAAAGGLFLMGGAGIMAAVFYQSGGIITIILVVFLLASIDIHGTEQDREPEET